MAEEKRWSRIDEVANMEIIFPFDVVKENMNGENEKEKKSVSVIFKPEPKKWGLRGDPYLWFDLEKEFVTIS